MKLKEALKRVTALLPKDKNKSFFHKVRFVSKPSSVFLTDGLQSSLVYVDDYLPDLLCSSEIITKAVKGKGDLAITEQGDGRFALCSETNLYHIQGESLASFPKPIVPESKLAFDEIDHTPIGSVVYCASKNEKNGGLPFINFGDGFVEATDTFRLCRVDYDLPWQGVLPSALFNKWPKKVKEAGFAVDEYYVYFKLDDEYRISIIPESKYPNTTNAITLNDDLGLGVVFRKDLLNTVIQATDISEIKGVSLIFNNDDLSIKALGRDHVLEDYKGSVAMDGIVREGSISVSGKLLSQCLRNLKGNFVNITYGVYPGPLVLRSGDTKVVIWPMLSE